MFHFLFQVVDCEIKLLAKEGVYVWYFPRPILKAPLPPDRHVDVMFRCAFEVDHEIRMY